jgi:hypothetical protein
MQLPTSDCNELVEKTAATLDNAVLQALLVSTQQNQMELCFQYATRYVQSGDDV